MADASNKDKRTSKRPSKEGSTSSKTKNVPAPAQGSTMPSPAPVDQPTFDKLHTIQKDWAQREWIEAVNASMKKIVDFLNKFEISTRYRLATLNQKLSLLERQMDYLEDQANDNVAAEE